MGINIVYLVDKIIRGGGERLILDLIQGLDDEHDVEIWNLGNKNEDMCDELESAGCTHRQIGQFGKRSKYAFRPLVPVLAELRMRDIDVLHGFSMYTNVLARLAGIRHGDTRIISHIHGVSDNGLPKYANVLTNRLSDTTITVSDAVKESIYGSSRGVLRVIAGSDIRTVHNSVDLDHLDSFLNTSKDVRKKFDVPNDSEVVVSVGRAVTAKNHIMLLRSFERIDREGVFLILIGSGPLLSTYEDYVSQSNLSQCVRITGELDHSMVMDLVASSELFVAPSLQEGFGIALIEALSLKTPTVASDIPTYREVTNEESTAFVDPESSVDLALTIEHLLDNPSKRESMAKAGRELVESRYRVEVMLEQYREIYEIE